jgi:hypothetical protein
LLQMPEVRETSARAVVTDVDSRARTPTEFDVYGLEIRVVTAWREIAEAIALDLAWFDAKGPTRDPVEIVIERREPDYDDLGTAVASFVTPRNTVYADGPRTIVDYFGQAVSIVDRRSRQVRIQGTNAHLVHEAAYHFVLSRVGEHLDARGLPRLHALAVSGAQGAVAVMLPSGGGKSTLALQALQDDTAKLISEDSPLLDRHGMLHPFPLRIGVNATDAALLPAEAVHRIERMEFHPKLLLDLAPFAHRIETRPQPLRHLVIGRRALGRTPQLESVSKRAAVGPLLREAVVGVGLYQGLEFVLQRGMRDVLTKTGAAFTRSHCCAAALRRANVWRLTIGRDHEANWSLLRTLLK